VYDHPFLAVLLELTKPGIDQSNLAERESQVQLMASIYAKASQTLIWLGEETSDVKGWARASYAIRKFFPDGAFRENVESLTQERREFQKYHARRLLLGLDNIYSTVHAIAIGNLYMRPWFRRKWVIQEVVKSHCPVLVCGNERVPWRVWEENAFYFFRYGFPIKLLISFLEEYAEIPLQIRVAFIYLEER